MIKIGGFLLLLLLPIVSTNDDSNVTSSEESQNLTLSEDFQLGKDIDLDDDNDDAIRIPTSSEEVEPVTDSPYIPMLTRCSTDVDCSSDRACIDRKCLVSPRGFDFLAVFRSCRSSEDCAPGHRCIISKCFPFRW